MNTNTDEIVRDTSIQRSWDEMAEDASQGKVGDPIVADYLSEMSELAKRMKIAAESKDLAALNEITLELCRTSQKLRLDVGKLSFLDSFTRSKIWNVLDEALNTLLPLKEQVATELEESARQLFTYAIRNIRLRQSELQPETSDHREPAVPR